MVIPLLSFSFTEGQRSPVTPGSSQTTHPTSPAWVTWVYFSPAPCRHCFLWSHSKRGRRVVFLSCLFDLLTIHTFNFTRKNKTKEIRWLDVCHASNRLLSTHHWSQTVAIRKCRQVWCCAWKHNAKVRNGSRRHFLKQTSVIAEW